MLADVKELNYVVLRPTGVYGPRERDYAMMADSIRRHVDFAVGYRPQVLTFIYVADLVDAAFLALTHGRTGRKYFLTACVIVCVIACLLSFLAAVGLWLQL